MTVQIRCHYDVLGVPRDADASAIKKAHRRAALIHHPDKNVNKSEDEREGSVDEFKLVQAAYECLSDPVERKWYDEHRDMILRGGIAGNGGAGEGGGDSFVYDVMPFHNAGCYDGYDDDDPDGFYSVYEGAFNRIFQGERDGYVSEGNIDVEKMSNAHLSEVRLGDSASAWEDVLAFYNAWEGFTSCLSFAWEDDYHLNDIREAPNRRIRRLMEDENKKKRKAAKKERVEDVCALVRFVKKRDPRVRVQMAKSLREQAMREIEKKKEAELRKKDILAAKEVSVCTCEPAFSITPNVRLQFCIMQYF
jgi:DnaJ family protein A protein 5